LKPQTAFGLQKTIIILTGHEACETKYNLSLPVPDNSLPHFITDDDL